MMLLRYFRRVWRAAFCKEPDRFYCFMFSRLVREGLSYKAAQREVERTHALDLVAWYRGR